MKNRPHVLHITYVDANKRKYVCDSLERARKLLSRYTKLDRVHTYGIYEYDKQTNTQGLLVERDHLQPLLSKVDEWFVLYITFVDGNQRKFVCNGKQRVNHVVKQFLGRIHDYGVYEYDKGKGKQGIEVIRKTFNKTVDRTLPK
ncbi:hypothetical protein [Algivirga pacifica]|uniref:Uncharacterized protein n=1 Tax=Algivirga pacifica TaxID=1162670 RepID=A0ABP9DEY7_9BACT